jgi:hypothetical protein
LDAGRPQFRGGQVKRRRAANAGQTPLSQLPNIPVDENMHASGYFIEYIQPI